MNITVLPSHLNGAVEIPSSKSCAHRLMIAAALTDRPTEVRMNARSRDIDATAGCLESLGAGIAPLDGTDGECGFRITPIGPNPKQGQTLFCAESGSTLRFMLPVAAALGAECTFTGEGRLPERPNAILTEAMRAHGVRADSDLLPMRLSGRLTGGEYPIAGNVSSQYLTGLMFALPLCEADSRIVLTTALESAAYLDITRDALKLFGVEVIPEDGGYSIPGNQRYRSPGVAQTEGDWSGAAFWLAANRIGHRIRLTGLNPASPQGDRAIVQQLDMLGGEIDVSGTPDAVPALAVAAALHPGTTRITGAARLRIKESDRLSSVTNMLTALGGCVEELPDGLIIHGGRPLTGGRVDGCNDHRIVMAAAIAATAASGPVEITDAGAVSKSYPAFFSDFNALGGITHVE